MALHKVAERLFGARSPILTTRLMSNRPLQRTVAFGARPGELNHIENKVGRREAGKEVRYMSGCLSGL
jgi:hypothetical protein